MRKHKICGILNLTEPTQSLNPLVLSRPVAALPFCSRYRLIDFPLSNLTAADTRTIGVFINGNLRSIYDHVRSGEEWGLDSLNGGLFFFSAARAGGAGGDIDNFFNNVEFIEKSGADYVAIMGTRMLCNIDVQAVLRSHIEQGAQITAVYKTTGRQVGDNRRLNCLSIGEDGHIQSIRSCAGCSGCEKALINMDIYILKGSLLIRLIRNAVAGNEHCDLNDVLHRAIIRLPASGFEYTGYMKPIGSIKDYYDGNMEMLLEANRTALLSGSQPIHTKVKNEAPTYYARSSDVCDSLVANGCLIRGTVRHSVVFRNVTIEKNAVVTHSVIMQDSYIGSGAQLDFVILDKCVRIEANTRLVGTAEKPIVIEKNSVVSRIYEQAELGDNKYKQTLS